MRIWTISGCFIGYLEKSIGYNFHFPNQSLKVVKTHKARFIKKGEISGGKKIKNWIIQKLVSKFHYLELIKKLLIQFLNEMMTMFHSDDYSLHNYTINWIHHRRITWSSIKKISREINICYSELFYCIYKNHILIKKSQEPGFIFTSNRKFKFH